MENGDSQVCSLDNLGLANGVRLHYCQARQQHWLLFPEGASALNPTAVAILASCDSHRSFEAIFQTLESQFRDVNTSQVRNLLLQMMRRGLLVNKI